MSETQVDKGYFQKDADRLDRIEETLRELILCSAPIPEVDRLVAMLEGAE